MDPSRCGNGATSKRWPSLELLALLPKSLESDFRSMATNLASPTVTAICRCGMWVWVQRIVVHFSYVSPVFFFYLLRFMNICRIWLQCCTKKVEFSVQKQNYRNQILFSALLRLLGVMFYSVTFLHHSNIVEKKKL